MDLVTLDRAQRQNKMTSHLNNLKQILYFSPLYTSVYTYM